MDIDLDLLMEKACSTTQGRLKAQFVLAELEKLAPAYHDETTREAAEEALMKWSSLGDDPLKKGLALAWLGRARAALAPGGKALASAASAVKGAAHQAAGSVRQANAAVNTAVGNAGAKAGERFANSPFNANRRGAIEARGGKIAQQRLTNRLKRQTPRPQPFFELEAEPAPRLEFGGSRRSPGVFELETAPAPRLEPDGHEAALVSAFRAGAKHAGERHAAAVSRVGRMAATHAFKIGRTVAATGAAIGVAGVASRHLSQAQHEQRVQAGKHSHDRHHSVAKSADQVAHAPLGKLLGALSVLGHAAVDSVAPASVQHAVGLQTGEEAIRAKAKATRARHAALHAGLKTALTPKPAAPAAPAGVI